MKRIAPGYYEGEYKDIKFTVHKVEQIDSSTKNQWFWTINNKPAEDWYGSKRIAILAAKDAIDEIQK